MARTDFNRSPFFSPAGPAGDGPAADLGEAEAWQTFNAGDPADHGASWEAAWIDLGGEG